jgi:pyruvate,water dikinase
VQHGGILSHGAITAREFSLPAVLGVKGLLNLVKHGDTIIVDGGKGTIEIVEGESEL